MATLVKFYVEPDNGILAFFPQINYCKPRYGNKTKMSYAHMGQHSACNVDYVKDLKPSTDLSACLDLISELNNVGYELKILNKFL